MKEKNFKLVINAEIEGRTIPQILVALEMIKEETQKLKNRIITNKSNLETGNLSFGDLKLEFLKNWNLISGLEMED